MVVVVAWVGVAVGDATGSVEPVLLSPEELPEPLPEEPLPEEPLLLPEPELELPEPSEEEPPSEPLPEEVLSEPVLPSVVVASVLSDSDVEDEVADDVAGVAVGVTETEGVAPDSSVRTVTVVSNILSAGAQHDLGASQAVRVRAVTTTKLIKTSVLFIVFNLVFGLLITLLSFCIPFINSKSKNVTNKLWCL